jgi:hypothetical protein
MALIELKQHQPALLPQTPPVSDVPLGPEFTIYVSAFESLLPVIINNIEAETLWLQM